MIVQCPQCQTRLNVAKMPASGLVRCSKCHNKLRVSGNRQPAATGKPSADRRAAAPPPAKRPVPAAAAAVANPFELPDPGDFVGSGPSPDADNPFGDLPGGGFEPIDASTSDDPFGGGPDASPFDMPDADPFGAPAGGAAMPAAVGPPARAFATRPRPAPAPEPQSPPPPATSPLIDGPKPLMIATGVSAAVFVLLLFGVGGVAAYQNSPGGSASSNPAASDAPPGFTLFEEHGVTIHLPQGSEVEVHKSAWATKTIQTNTGAVYFVGVTPSTNIWEGKKLQRRMDNFMSGGFLAAGVVNRNGYEGSKGRLDQCIYLPTMNLEVYQLDGRFAVIGISAGGSRDAAGNTVVGQSSEPENEKEFYDSFTIGPMPTGGFW